MGSSAGSVLVYVHTYIQYISGRKRQSVPYPYSYSLPYFLLRSTVLLLRGMAWMEGMLKLMVVSTGILYDQGVE